jgi:REP-associated tyrosine transposase
VVLGSHVIFAAYGFWLPNNPRGSWSDFVGSWELFRFGPASKMEGGDRRSTAHLPHDRALRLTAKQALKRPPVSVNEVQIQAIARGFANFISHSQLHVWVCSIMPEHVHIAHERHRKDFEILVIGLKRYATEQLLDEGLHPFQQECTRVKAPPK